MKFPFVGGAYAGRSLNVNAQTCRNLMVELDPTVPEGRVLVNTPGYVSVASSGGTNFRGLICDLNRTGNVYCAIDGELYSYATNSGIFTAVTTFGGNTWSMANTNTKVSMAMMGLAGTNAAVAVASGPELNVYSQTGPAAAQISSGGNPVQANTVCFMDGRFIADNQYTPGQFVYSDILAPTTWSAFNFASAEGSPDSLRAVHVNRRELYLFGETSTEIWYATGDGNDPFARYQGGFIETGIAAPRTICDIDNSFMWLARDKNGQIYVAGMGGGNQPVVLSPAGINYRLQQVSKSVGSGVTLTNAYATTYRIAGHECYVLTVPVDNSTTQVTYVYDAVTKEWHEWGSGSSGAHKVRAIVGVETLDASYGAYMCLTDSDDLFRLAPDLYTDNGAAIYRERTTVGVSDEQDRIKIAHLQIDMEEGVSTTLKRDSVTQFTTEPPGSVELYTVATNAIDTGDTMALTLDDGRIHLATVTGGPYSGTLFGFDTPLPSQASVGNVCQVYADDRCTIETSKDGGQTWGTATTLHMGVATTKARRVILRKLGMARHWVLRWKTSAAVKIVIRGVVAKLWGEA